MSLFCFVKVRFFFLSKCESSLRFIRYCSELKKFLLDMFCILKYNLVQLKFLTLLSSFLELTKKKKKNIIHYKKKLKNENNKLWKKMIISEWMFIFQLKYLLYITIASSPEWWIPHCRIDIRTPKISNNWLSDI